MQEILLPEELEIVKPVVNRNAFMTHPENILLAALEDRESESSSSKSTTGKEKFVLKSSTSVARI